MSDFSAGSTAALFPLGYRASGILLHATSLPSPYGIGDLGPTAFEWIDRLAESGQGWWQVLPLGPTGYGNSPYQPLSSFAGSALLVSPDGLAEGGLLNLADHAGQAFPADRVDFERVIQLKHDMLHRAWDNFRAGAAAHLRPEFEQFCHDQAHWLDDYALFRALKARHDDAHYLRWPAELIRRDAAALARARTELAAEMDVFRFRQFLVFRQADRLKEYAHRRGVRLVGDLPFFPSPDSADIWSHPELFLLDEQCRPRSVAGVPPDYFAPQGQLWGNPVYNWEALRQTGFQWWIDRVRALLAHVDVVRLDHFRGFCAAWHVPAGAATAQSGQWVPGPGADLFDAVQQALGHLPFVAEDLGLITPDVWALRDRFHLPGTRVLQFAFDGNPINPHLPNTYPHNTVAYTGTHDNDTTRGWYATLPEAQRRVLRGYLQLQSADEQAVAWDQIGLAWTSPAALAVAPLQDVLNLGSKARMNVPGRAAGNWDWRCTANQLDGPALRRLGDLTWASMRRAQRTVSSTARPEPELIRT
jgi:4-alpha-glucanotransferase